MAENLINNELTINVPDDYKVLNEMEIVAFSHHPADNNFVIRNAEKHSAIDIAWSKTNFLTRLFSIARLAAITKDNIRKANPFFKMGENVSDTISGIEAKGFRYTYRTKGGMQTGEYLLIRRNDNLYSFTFISRTDLLEENRPVFKEVISTIRFKD